MRGNISKIIGVRGEKGDKGEKGDRGIQGERGEKGDIPSLSFRYDKETGNLYFKVDGIYMSNDDVITKEDVEELVKLASAPSYSVVTILGGDENWVEEDVFDSNNNVIGKRYVQEVQIDNITPNSKIDLQLSPEQLVIFYEKDLAFVTENDNGKVTIHCVGTIPQNNYDVQVMITEVINNG